MVLLNPTNTTLVADAHTVPTVQLQDTARTRLVIAATHDPALIACAKSRMVMP